MRYLQPEEMSMVNTSSWYNRTAMWTYSILHRGPNNTLRSLCQRHSCRRTQRKLGESSRRKESYRSPDAGRRNGAEGMISPHEDGSDDTEGDGRCPERQLLTAASQAYTYEWTDVNEAGSGVTWKLAEHRSGELGFPGRVPAVAVIWRKAAQHPRA